ncbi:MAG: hypothetical protein A2X94_17670 [Bdellovibrionales bacterium GWB1_55_8]|nr:MAG: hypothetical protein A2X94_17670 [Bdellovibrionales bacterium GWB1_55_8]
MRWFTQNKTPELQVGSPAPRLPGIDQDGATIELGALYETDKRVLVYFYPKADTPGCTAQACSIRDEYAVLQEEDVTILGVSTDSIKTQKEFQRKYRLPFRLIADKGGEWAKAFGVPVRLGFTSRQAFLIEEGKIAWLDRKASTQEQARDVLRFLGDR